MVCSLRCASPCLPCTVHGKCMGDLWMKCSSPASAVAVWAAIGACLWARSMHVSAFPRCTKRAVVNRSGGGEGKRSHCATEGKLRPPHLQQPALPAASPCVPHRTVPPLYRPQVRGHHQQAQVEHGHPGAAEVPQHAGGAGRVVGRGGAEGGGAGAAGRQAAGRASSPRGAGRQGRLGRTPCHRLWCSTSRRGAEVQSGKHGRAGEGRKWGMGPLDQSAPPLAPSGGRDVCGGKHLR